MIYRAFAARIIGAILAACYLLIIGARLTRPRHRKDGVRLQRRERREWDAIVAGNPGLHRSRP